MKLIIQNNKTIIINNNNEILTALDIPLFDFKYNFLTIDDNNMITAKENEEILNISEDQKKQIVSFYSHYSTDQRIVYLMRNSTVALSYLESTDFEIVKIMEKRLLNIPYEEDDILLLYSKRKDARVNLFFIEDSKNKSLARLLKAELD